MTIFTIRSGATAHPEDSVLQMAGDLVAEGGVKVFATDFKVQEKTIPDLSVDVLSGRAYVQRSSSNVYPVRSTATENKPITSNASGNPRIDTVVLYIDLAATPNADGSGVAKLENIEGTPAASPTAPNDTEVGTQIGAANPFMRLADVYVASGATTILNANITDKRQLWELKTPIVNVEEQATAPGTPDSGETAIYSKTDGKLYAKDDTGKERIAADEDWVDLTDGATINIDLRLGKKFRVTIAGNRTFTISNDVTGKTFVVRVKQDGVGGRTVIWFANLVWAGQTAPTLTTTINRADEFGFNILTGGGVSSEGFVIGQDI